MPKSQLHPVGSQSDPVTGKREISRNMLMLYLSNSGVSCFEWKPSHNVVHWHSLKSEMFWKFKEYNTISNCWFQFSSCSIWPLIRLLLLIFLMEAWIHLLFHYPCRPNHDCDECRQLLHWAPYAYRCMTCCSGDKSYKCVTKQWEFQFYLESIDREGERNDEAETGSVKRVTETVVSMIKVRWQKSEADRDE